MDNESYDKRLKMIYHWLCIRRLHLNFYGEEDGLFFIHEMFMGKLFCDREEGCRGFMI
jgi:hypothetical protein